MKKIILFILVLVTAFIIWGEQPHANPTPDAVTKASTAGINPWSGTWTSERDDNTTIFIEFSMKNHRITGSYYFETDTGSKATFYKCSQKGDILTGFWREGDETGWFEFTLTDSIDQFAGKWGYSGSNEPQGIWFGKKD